MLVNLWIVRMTTLSDIDRLADRIAALVTAQARSSDFWDMYDIAYHLRASKSTVTRWVALPGFPRPIRPLAEGLGIRCICLLRCASGRLDIARARQAGRGVRERRRHDHPSATPKRGADGSVIAESNSVQEKYVWYKLTKGRS